MLSAKSVRNAVWVLSILAGPAVAYFITRALGRISWICEKLQLCRVKLFIFFALGFAGVWAIYWTAFFAVRAVKKNRPQSPKTTD